MPRKIDRCSSCGMPMDLPPSHFRAGKTKKELRALPPLLCGVCKGRDDKRRVREEE